MKFGIFLTLIFSSLFSLAGFDRSDEDLVKDFFIENKIPQMAIGTNDEKIENFKVQMDAKDEFAAYFENTQFNLKNTENQVIYKYNSSLVDDMKCELNATVNSLANSSSSLSKGLFHLINGNSLREKIESLVTYFSSIPSEYLYKYIITSPSELKDTPPEANPAFKNSEGLRSYDLFKYLKKLAVENKLESDLSLVFFDLRNVDNINRKMHTLSKKSSFELQGQMTKLLALSLANGFNPIVQFGYYPRNPFFALSKESLNESRFGGHAITIIGAGSSRNVHKRGELVDILTPFNKVSFFKFYDSLQGKTGFFYKEHQPPFNEANLADQDIRDLVFARNYINILSPEKNFRDLSIRSNLYFESVIFAIPRGSPAELFLKQFEIQDY